MRGDLANRIRTTGSGDELDQLGRNLNDMLDRLQGLMDGLKQVSNDIAHDLRTPLSRLKQRLEEVRSEANSVQDYKEAVDQAVQDADIALSTFGALLRIAQIESGSRRANFVDLDLSSLLANLAITYSAVAEDMGKTLVSSVDPDIHVRGDRELLTQLFVNLIENALRHTPEGATVSMSLAHREQGPFAEVCDNGPGIPETDAETSSSASTGWNAAEAHREVDLGLPRSLPSPISIPHVSSSSTTNPDSRSRFNSKTHDNSAGPQAVTIICCEVSTFGKVTTLHYSKENVRLWHLADMVLVHSDVRF